MVGSRYQQADCCSAVVTEMKPNVEAVTSKAKCNPVIGHLLQSNDAVRKGARGIQDITLPESEQQE